jgi:hypothetical protein
VYRLLFTIFVFVNGIGALADVIWVWRTVEYNSKSGNGYGRHGRQITGPSNLSFNPCWTTWDYLAADREDTGDNFKQKSSVSSGHPYTS